MRDRITAAAGEGAAVMRLYGTLRRSAGGSGRRVMRE